MFQDFIDWLDEQIKERGLGGVLVGTGGLLGLAGAAGTLFGTLPLRAAALVAVLLGALAVAIYLVGDSRRARHDLARVAKLLQQYCQVVSERSGVTLDISNWVQTVELNERGDATVTRRISLAPTGERLHFLHLDLGQYGTAPSARLRRRVRAVAREISVDGQEGARFVTTESWRDECWHQILVHFSEPVPVGNPVTVEVRWEWPMYSNELMEGGVENFDVRFHHPVQVATQEIRIRKRRPGDRFVASRIGTLTSFEPENTAESYGIRFSIVRPQARIRYGVRVDKTR